MFDKDTSEHILYEQLHHTVLLKRYPFIVVCIFFHFEFGLSEPRFFSSSFFPHFLNPPQEMFVTIWVRLQQCHPILPVYVPFYFYLLYPLPVFIYGITLSVCPAVCPSVVLSMCPLSISWTAQPFMTKLGMLVYYHKVMCHAEKLAHFSSMSRSQQGLT